MIAIGSFDNLRMNNLNIISWEYIVQSPLSFCSYKAIIGKRFCRPWRLIIWRSTWLKLRMNLLEWDCVRNEVKISRDKKIFFPWLDVLRKILYFSFLCRSLFKSVSIGKVCGCDIEKFSLREEYSCRYTHSSFIRIIITPTLPLSHKKIFWIPEWILRENSISYGFSLLIGMRWVIGMICLRMLSNVVWNINPLCWFCIHCQFL